MVSEYFKLLQKIDSDHSCWIQCPISTYSFFFLIWIYWELFSSEDPMICSSRLYFQTRVNNEMERGRNFIKLRTSSHPPCTRSERKPEIRCDTSPQATWHKPLEKLPKPTKLTSSMHPRKFSICPRNSSEKWPWPPRKIPKCMFSSKNRPPSRFFTALSSICKYYNKSVWARCRSLSLSFSEGILKHWHFHLRKWISYANN